ncbi:uncharacterized protein LOC110407496 [Numida meleagris]|uniref:uncharacterized protein LOC110407496 n=1 Tax=Numida meleagris TaxID=8996 RepID=UPI000B3DFA03|nr:uncharacterized protein LOC110407496 [Numida meleagris]
MDRDPRATLQGSVNLTDQMQGPGHAAFQDRSRVLARKEERDKSHLKISGNLFIKQFLHLLTKRQLAEDIKTQYMEKVLHAVFFFGRLHKRQMRPNDFLEPSTLQTLQAKYPQSFQQYGTHLPSLTPYSILLQFGNEVVGCSTQEEMESFLREFNSAVQTAMQQQEHIMKPSNFIFRAAIVSYSFYREPQNKAGFPLFYGASLSCSGEAEREIMISILCLRTWHKAVAFAVYHGLDDLAIVFPDEVQCRAFCYSNGAFKEKPPCVKCKKMYHVDFQPSVGDTREDVQWPYGNCAENESLSKLLQGVPGLQEKVTTTDLDTYQSIEQEFASKIEASFRDQLIKLLQKKNFPLPLQFFEPQ